jgi:integrating conjugative element protein (TIGR03765 family)
MCGFALVTLAAYGGDESLIVVEDRGGVSALPYYEALRLKTGTAPETAPPPSDLARAPGVRFSEADLLPVRSRLLTPGVVGRRRIEAPGLRPLFLVGDDERSRAWLRQRGDILRELNAVGLVVNVESPATLEELRGLAPGLTLSPTSGDDIAQRLGLKHYPVLITATSVEQ